MKGLKGRIELTKYRFSKVGLLSKILGILSIVLAGIAVVLLVNNCFLLGYFTGTSAVVFMLVYTDRLEKVNKEYNQQLNSIRRKYGFRERN